ncbi:hypothetical protein Fmac_019972 [Flemingia macrophylla]|uniref:Photosystem II protein K n=1 Tax=Flemingia macrophylla TaxID=520843 RepID=A0ABD1M9C1_9FABA
MYPCSNRVILSIQQFPVTLFNIASFFSSPFPFITALVISHISFLFPSYLS